MTDIQYSTASFLHSALRSSEQLVYLTSATFGTDWEYTLHSHSFAEVFFVTSGEGIFCANFAEVPIHGTNQSRHASYRTLLRSGAADLHDYGN